METGTRLGPYEILEQLGAGGMGEVWLAQDTRLGRKVAVKVLPPQFASDAERLARFEQEARAAAALNHPNIAAVFDVGAQPAGDGSTTHFMVQEHLQGHSLRTVLDRGALELKRALALGGEIAEALKAAHRAGIVHRDLKPENVFVTEDGHAKVLDFGLAKLTEVSSGPLGSQSMSPTVLGTQAGAIMGTAGYMAPEQVQGEEVDARADVFALGCVLWEMVTGQRAFAGKSVPHTLHKIMDEEPEGKDTPAGRALPLRLRWLLQRALAKSRDARAQSAADVLAELRQIATEVESGTAITEAGAPSSAAAPAPSAWRIAVPVAVAALAVGAVATLVLARGIGSGNAAAEPVRRVEIRLVPDDEPALMARLGSNVVLSPDGDRLFYTLGDPATNSRIWSRSLDQLQGLELVSAERVYHPFLSPDGAWLGFTSLDELLRVPTSGGTPQRVATVNLGRGAVWGTDGTIIFSPGLASPLMRVSELGGEPEALTVLDDEREEVSHRWPALTQDGESVVFTVRARSTGNEDAELVALRLETGERVDLGIRGYFARTLPTGHLVWVREGTLFAAQFDEERLQTIGSPRPVVQGLTTDPLEGGAQYSVAGDGTLAYIAGANSSSAQYDLAWVEPDGNVTVLELGLDLGGVSISPEDDRIAFTQSQDGEVDVWVYDIERAIPTRITFSPGEDQEPHWSPDGAYLYFTCSAAQAICRVRADGAGEPEVIDERLAAVEDVSPDGKWLLIEEDDDILAIAPDGQQEPVVVADSSANESHGAFSPDGRWVAYSSDESGVRQVYVRPFPEGTGRWQLSNPADGNSYQPHWSADGGTVFYVGSGSIRATDVSTREDALVPGESYAYASDLSAQGFAAVGLGVRQGTQFTPSFDVAHHDRRVLAMRRGGAGGETGPRHVVMVFNWFNELNRLVPIER